MEWHLEAIIDDVARGGFFAGAKVAAMVWNGTLASWLGIERDQNFVTRSAHARKARPPRQRWPASLRFHFCVGRASNALQRPLIGLESRREVEPGPPGQIGRYPRNVESRLHIRNIVGSGNQPRISAC